MCARARVRACVCVCVYYVYDGGAGRHPDEVGPEEEGGGGAAQRAAQVRPVVHPAAAPRRPAVRA